MALPSSGQPISFSQLRSEYGPYPNGGTGSISMSQLYLRSSQQSGNPYVVKDYVWHSARLALVDGSAYSSSKGENLNYCRPHTFFTTSVGGAPAPDPAFHSYTFIWNGYTLSSGTVQYTGYGNVHMSYAESVSVTYQIYPCSTGYTFNSSNRGNPTTTGGVPRATQLNTANWDYDTGVSEGFPLPYRTNYTELCITKWYNGYPEDLNKDVPTGGTMSMSQFWGCKQPGKRPYWTEYYGKHISNTDGTAQWVPLSW